MANFYTDTPSLRHHLHHPLMRRIVELKERNFRDKDTYPTLRTMGLDPAPLGPPQATNVRLIPSNMTSRAVRRRKGRLVLMSTFSPVMDGDEDLGNPNPPHPLQR